MTIATPKYVRMKYAVQIFKKKAIAREMKIALLGSIALLMIRNVMKLKLTEDPVQRTQNVDGSLAVFKILTVLFRHANIGGQYRMASKLGRQRSKIPITSVRVYIQNSMRKTRKHTACQLRFQI